MSTWIWVVIAVVVVLVVAGAIWAATAQARSRRLRERFGSEYDRTVADAPTRREAEAQLADRADRRDRLDIRPLNEQSAARYADEWRQVQARFVDDPEGAVGEADALVHRVMSERGYPMASFEAESELVSVDHPDVVENYRAAHGISLARDDDRADTEDLRRAMVHYRALFDELLETRESLRR